MKLLQLDAPKEIERYRAPEEHVANARAAMLRERAQLERDFGVRFDPFKDGRILRERRRK